MLSIEPLSHFLLLAIAFILSSLIGLEREFRLRSAGLRTHALVGLGAALFMLISKFGFSDILSLNHVGLDPSRIAAQVVSGIGFIGAGLIFVKQDSVRGLTTAAAIWVTAAVGMACGAGLPLLGVAATVGHFIVAFGYSALVSHLFGFEAHLDITYQAEQETLLRITELCAENSITVRECEIHREDGATTTLSSLFLQLPHDIMLVDLITEMSTIDGVLSINSPTSRLKKGENGTVGRLH